MALPRAGQRGASVLLPWAARAISKGTSHRQREAGGPGGLVGRCHRESPSLPAALYFRHKQWKERGSSEPGAVCLAPTPPPTPRSPLLGKLLAWMVAGSPGTPRHRQPGRPDRLRWEDNAGCWGQLRGEEAGRPNSQGSGRGSSPIRGDRAAAQASGQVGRWAGGPARGSPCR